jgi:metal-responsive CopG/Arc/MetJ family transcriptional regulator
MSKVMVSLPDDLMELVDAEAKKRATSRSALLAEALRRELARRDLDAVNAAIARSQRRFRDAESFESTDLVRSTRDSAR